MRIADLSGRGLCEASYSKSVIALTLTYAPSDMGYERNLTKSHFQDFIRALRDSYRNQKTTIRYIAAGEYGESKGRAHFHCILFFDNDSPPWPHRKRFHLSAWGWGHCYADFLDPSISGDASIRYVAKYLLKDEQKRDSWFSTSKNPLLGDKFITFKAAQNVAAGVWPQTFLYRPPYTDGRKTYIFRGAARRKFMERIIAGHIGYGRQINPCQFSESTKVQFEACWKKFRIDEANEKGLTYQMCRISEDIDRYRPKVNTVLRSLYATEEPLERVTYVESEAETQRRARSVRAKCDDAFARYANYVVRSEGDKG